MKANFDFNRLSESRKQELDHMVADFSEAGCLFVEDLFLEFLIDADNGIDRSDDKLVATFDDECGHELVFILSQEEVHYVIHLFCFWFQVIRQDDFSNWDFPQFLLHPMGKADRLCCTSGFPSVIYSDHSVGVFHHITISVGVDAWEIFFLYHNNIRTSLQQFTGSCFLI